MTPGRVDELAVVELTVVEEEETGLEIVEALEVTVVVLRGSDVEYVDDVDVVGVIGMRAPAMTETLSPSSLATKTSPLAES
jgi:hypothetical protein